MDDMKKLIERYKKELMEMSGKCRDNARAPLVVGYSDEGDGEKIGEEIIRAAGDDSAVEGCLGNELLEEELQGEELQEELQEEEKLREELQEEELREEIREEDVFDSPVWRMPTGAERGETPAASDDPEGEGDLGSSEISGDESAEEGSRTDIDPFPVAEFSSLEDFKEKNSGAGSMSFRVFTAREALPVGGARVVVTKTIAGKKYPFFELSTNSSGRTNAENLPAPDKNLSLMSDNKVQPFSLYDAVVTSAGFAKVELSDIPVFDGVSSIQRVAMVPAGEPAENGGEILEVNENGEG